MAEATTLPDATDAQSRHSGLGLELLIVILLGLVSVATAYASFQSSLYGSQMAAAYAKGNDARTEAESIFLEANQQYMADAQTWRQLVLLEVEAMSSDPAVAELARAKAEELRFIAVDEVLQAAIDWSAAEGAADPEYYHDPQSSDEYLAARFDAYTDKLAESQQHLAAGDVANGYGDQLTLYTVLMAITLFLLGIAAVVRLHVVKWVLIGVGTAIFIVAAILTALVPFVGLG